MSRRNIIHSINKLKFEKIQFINDDSFFLDFIYKETNSLLCLMTSFNISPLENLFFDLSDPSYSFKIIHKYDLKRIIEFCHDEIVSSMENNLKIMQNDPEYAVALFHQRKQYWRMDNLPLFCRDRALPYVLKDNKIQTDGDIVAIPLLEYHIFNLVSLYNHFDWENEILFVVSY